MNDPKIFTLEDPDLEVFLSLPEWLQDKIKSNLEYAGSPLQDLLEGGNGKAKGEDTKAPEEAPEPDFEEEEGGDDVPW